MTEYRGHTFCPSIYKVNDHWYIWIYVLASRRTAARFEAELGMEENGLRIAGPCPVVSVDDRLDEVLRREETLEMSNRSCQKYLNHKGECQCDFSQALGCRGGPRGSHGSGEEGGILREVQRKVMEDGFFFKKNPDYENKLADVSGS